MEAREATATGESCMRVDAIAGNDSNL
ncbi:hypothetical protein, partial [Escherichia coli]